MLRKRIKTLLIFALYIAIVVVVATIGGLYGLVLLCDVWQWQCWICQ